MITQKRKMLQAGWTSALLFALLMGGCGVFQRTLPDVGRLQIPELLQIPSDAYASINKPGMSPVEYLVPIAVVKLGPDDRHADVNGSPEQHYDVIVEACTRGRPPNGLDTWHYAHRADETLTLSNRSGTIRITPRVEYVEPLPSNMTVTYGAPCSRTDLAGIVPDPMQPSGEVSWWRTRWSYPIVADLAGLDHVYVGPGPKGELYRWGEDGLRLALSGRSIPIIDEATLAATKTTTNKSNSGASTPR